MSGPRVYTQHDMRIAAVTLQCFGGFELIHPADYANAAYCIDAVDPCAGHHRAVFADVLGVVVAPTALRRYY